jgi:REP element-mobilizing transposase RayT
MPNHVHLLIAVTNTVQPEKQTLDKMLIPKVIQSFKASVTRQAKAHETVWQNRFYDRIVRDEQEFQRIWTYIDNNPAQWQEDCYYT